GLVSTHRWRRAEVSGRGQDSKPKARAGPLSYAWPEPPRSVSRSSCDLEPCGTTLHGSGPSTPSIWVPAANAAHRGPRHGRCCAVGGKWYRSWLVSLDWRVRAEHSSDARGGRRLVRADRRVGDSSCSAGSRARTLSVQRRQAPPSVGRQGFSNPG